MIEIYSALARRKREGSVPAADCLIAAQAFTVHSATEYEFIELDQGIVSVARDLLERYSLRAYDAVQLASAIVANQTLALAQLAPLIFVSADNQLNGVATSEKLEVDNPNLHP